MSLLPVVHPLALNTKVNALRPSCACKNAKMEPTEGTILKVINNHNGKIYYFLSSGVTIESTNVQYVIP